MTGRSDLVDIEVVVKRETDRAWGVEDPGVGILGGHLGEVGPELAEHLALMRKRPAESGSTGIFKEGVDLDGLSQSVAVLLGGEGNALFFNWR